MKILFHKVLIAFWKKPHLYKAAKVTLRWQKNDENWSKKAESFVKINLNECEGKAKAAEQENHKLT